MGAVAFVRDGKVVYARGDGLADVSAGRRFTPATPADGGSLAKTFTAAVLWGLVHEGRVKIDAPVVTYVPEYPYPETTVRQLIAHTNGLPPYYEQFDPYFRADEVRSTTGLLAAIPKLQPRPRFVVGTRFEYSNVGFDVAALVIERVLARPIHAVFRERLFAPLRMDSAFARPARFVEWPGPRTLGYRWSDTAWVVKDVFDNEGFIGGSNVYASALDLALWAAANAAGTAVPHAVLERGQEHPVIDGHPSPITGLSWYCDDSHARCQYSGAINAFHSLAYWDREHRTAVSMVSNSDLTPWALITLQRDLVAALEGREPITPPRPDFLQARTAALDEFVGQYAAPNGHLIAVSAASTGLRLRENGGLEFDVFQVSTDTFYVPGLDYFLGFSDDPSNRRVHVRSMFRDFSALRVRPE